MPAVAGEHLLPGEPAQPQARTAAPARRSLGSAGPPPGMCPAGRPGRPRGAATRRSSRSAIACRSGPSQRRQAARRRLHRRRERPTRSRISGSSPATGRPTPGSSPKSRTAGRGRNETIFRRLSSRSQALPGNALSSRLRLAERIGDAVLLHARTAGRACAGRFRHSTAAAAGPRSRKPTGSGPWASPLPCVGDQRMMPAGTLPGTTTGAGVNTGGTIVAATVPPRPARVSRTISARPWRVDLHGHTFARLAAPERGLQLKAVSHFALGDRQDHVARLQFARRGRQF